MMPLTPLLWGAGIVLGILLTVSPSSCLIFTLIGLGAALISRSAEPEDRRFLLLAFLAGVTARIVVAFGLHTAAFCLGYRSGQAAYLPAITDDVAFSGVAWQLVKYWHGLSDLFTKSSEVRLGEYFVGLHTYVHAFLYNMFGWTPLALKYLNGLWGTLTAVFVFWMSRDLFGRQAARLACVAVLGWPTLFYWSISNLKEPFIILLICVILWALVRFGRTNRPRYLGYLAGSLFLLVHYRYQLLRPMLLVVIPSVGFLWRGGGIWRRRLLLGLCLAGLGLAVVRRQAVRQWCQQQLVTVMGVQIPAYMFRGPTYRVYEDRWYEHYAHGRPFSELQMGAGEFLKTSLKAWAYFILTPFPWSPLSLMQLAILPYMLLWYALLLCSWWGWVIAVKTRWRETLVLSGFIGVMGTAMALGEANVGSAFRHRDLLAPVLLLWAMLGARRLVQRQQRVEVA